MAKTSKDAYANVAFGTVTQSAANTLTFGQVQMGVGLFEGKAMLIHRIKYRPTSTALREIVTNADRIIVGLTTSNRLSAIFDVADPAIIDQKDIVGIGVGVEPYQLPLVTDFTMLPGGGKLVPANPLWVACMSQGFAAAAILRVDLEFTFVELSPQDYLEVIQSMFPANVL